jgi:hypothetical protein
MTERFYEEAEGKTRSDRGCNHGRFHRPGVIHCRPVGAACGPQGCPIYWTATWTRTARAQGEESLGPAYTDYRENTETAEVAADDPRMSGSFIQLDNVRASESRVGQGLLGFANGKARLDNDGGAWVGTYTAYFSDMSGSERWYVLEGEGAYQGLTAVFRWRSEDLRYWRWLDEL